MSTVFGIACVNLYVIVSIYLSIRKHGKEITFIFNKEEIREVYSNKKEIVVKISDIKKCKIYKNIIYIVAFYKRFIILYYSKDLVGKQDFKAIKEYIKLENIK